MPIWSRFSNALRPDRVRREIQEEMEEHIADAIAHGRDPEEARRAFGSLLRQREASSDVRLLPWLDSLRADTIFGWRQIRKRKVTSAAAVLSLALAIGASTSAFRLIDAVLLRPLPVAHPELLYLVSRETVGTDGNLTTIDSSHRLLFTLMRDAVKGDAELFANSHAMRMDLTYRSDQEMERAYMQYVSGSMFTSLGLEPAAGRTLAESDDGERAGHPYAVISHDYWKRRFAFDPQVVGRTFQMGGKMYEIIGVAPERFTGTNTGTMTEIYVPAAMSAADGSDWSWFRTFVHLRPGVRPEPVLARLRSAFAVYKQQRLPQLSGATQLQRDRFLAQKLLLDPAGAGISGMQQQIRRPLIILCILVALVLLVACANVANLLTAQAVARSREMALRVSIGAGRLRLLQLVLIESTWLAALAAVCGALFSWLATPLIVTMLARSDNPARLDLPLDWRVLAFGTGLTVAVTLLFGLTPALRAAGTLPSFALRGGAAASRQRFTRALIGAQVAFCFVVLFLAGLLIATFDRLALQPLGFSAERTLNIDCTAPRAQPAFYWESAAEHLRSVPGIERVSLAEWPLLSGYAWTGTIIVPGMPASEDGSYFLNVSADWRETMNIPLIAGRDFRPTETAPGVAIVTETFVKRYFNGTNPAGRFFEYENGPARVRVEIVGVVRDIRYRTMREPIEPVVLVPFKTHDATGAEANSRTRRDASGASIRGTFVIRTTSDRPERLASTLRQELLRAAPDLRITELRTERELAGNQMVIERLLALLASFFAAVALLLAGIGLYGVLDYSVVQRRREIGIRLAIGAGSGHIAARVTAPILVMVAGGAAVGFGLGIALARFVTAILYEVKPTDVGMLVLPWLIMIAAVLAAALPAVLRALRIDPVEMLRTD